MKILYGVEALEAPSAITIGVFDGVHAGHQKLLSLLDERSKEENLLRVVVTFDVHPISVLAPGHAPKMLLSLERKLKLLEETGLVDAVLVIAFDPVRAAQTAHDFVREVLADQLHARKILIGSNFVFGHERRGNVALLKEMSEELNFEVEPVDLLLNESESPISSTLIRQYISVGNVEKAQQLLTRPHELSGRVVPGDEVGNELGYPTANTHVEETMCIPSDAVYSGRVRLKDGRIFKSAISIGVRPMFHEDNIRVIEPYLLDFDELIYDQVITIEFVDKLREQLVLESVDALIDQIGRDVDAVRSTIEI